MFILRREPMPRPVMSFEDSLKEAATSKRAGILKSIEVMGRVYLLPQFTYPQEGAGWTFSSPFDLVPALGRLPEPVFLEAVPGLLNYYRLKQ